MDLNALKYTIMTWWRAYLYRLNNGSRPAVHPPEGFIELRREAKNRPWINLLLFVVTFFHHDLCRRVRR